MDIINLNTFLDFGYFLKYDNAQRLIDYASADPGSLKNLNDRELLTMGCDLFQKAIDEQFVPGREVCVPLSGGIDSRAILGGLLKCTEAKSIHTYAFGVPGAWDYEFEKIVAESVGTKHTQIDLNEYIYTQDELLVLTSIEIHLKNGREI
jgi:asparagine synthetase B (glutamine-hydrolysing)